MDDLLRHESLVLLHEPLGLGLQPWLCGEGLSGNRCLARASSHLCCEGPSAPRGRGSRGPCCARIGRGWAPKWVCWSSTGGLFLDPVVRWPR